MSCLGLMVKLLPSPILILVPCTKNLHLERAGGSSTVTSISQHDSDLKMDEDGTNELKQLTESKLTDDMDETEKFPTVLAEFSSVVADTQQYMLPTDEENKQVLASLQGWKL